MNDHKVHCLDWYIDLSKVLAIDVNQQDSFDLHFSENTKIVVCRERRSGDGWVCTPPEDFNRIRDKLVEYWKQLGKQ